MSKSKISIGKPRVVHALTIVSGRSLGGKQCILGDIDDAGDVALYRGAGEEKVDLVIGIAKSTEILDTAWFRSVMEAKQVG
jgi:hypothetical protein